MKVYFWIRKHVTIRPSSPGKVRRFIRQLFAQGDSMIVWESTQVATWELNAACLRPGDMVTSWVGDADDLMGC